MRICPQAAHDNKKAELPNSSFGSSAVLHVVRPVAFRASLGDPALSRTATIARYHINITLSSTCTRCKHFRHYPFFHESLDGWLLAEALMGTDAVVEDEIFSESQTKEPQIVDNVKILGTSRFFRHGRIHDLQTKPAQPKIAYACGVQKKSFAMSRVS
jgi:hypothetical protein